ncbi:hypothetical protein FB451DRAFT_1258800 [Mycena latifolia]|nr:hypothetical protein FB451DRAFT_1258800 [Mycena latifolia]
MQFLPHIPQQALLDLWSRTWPWMHFLDTYREIIPTCPEYLDLYWVFFAYIDRIPTSLVGSTPEFRTLIAKAWREFIAHGDPDARGFRELLHFVDSDSSTISDAHVTEYSAGAGGSLDDLAALVCDHLTMAQAEKNSTYIWSGVRFALAIESSVDSGTSIFHGSLRHRGVVSLLTEIIWKLTWDLFASDEDEHAAAEGLPEMLTDCLSLLVFELCHPAGHLWMPQAIRSQLLKVIVYLGATDATEEQVDYLLRLLQGTQRFTVYYSVLRELERTLPQVIGEVKAQDLPNSPIFYQWGEFISLAQDRLKLKAHLDSPDYITYRACDNLACGRIMQKAKFRSCARCSMAYYCDSSCQRLAWTEHRTLCGSLRSLHLSDPLTGHNKSFMRALVQQTYERNKLDILEMQVEHRCCSDGREFLIT